MRAKFSVAFALFTSTFSVWAFDPIYISLVTCGESFIETNDITRNTVIRRSLTSGVCTASASVNATSNVARTMASTLAPIVENTGAETRLTNTFISPFSDQRFIYLVYHFSSQMPFGNGGSESNIVVSSLFIYIRGAGAIQRPMQLVATSTPSYCDLVPFTLGCFIGTSVTVVGSIAILATPGLEIKTRWDTSSGINMIASAAPAEVSASATVSLRWSAKPVGPVFDPYAIGF